MKLFFELWVMCWKTWECLVTRFLSWLQTSLNIDAPPGPSRFEAQELDWGQKGVIHEAVDMKVSDSDVTVVDGRTNKKAKSWESQLASSKIWNEYLSFHAIISTDSPTWPGMKYLSLILLFVRINSFSKSFRLFVHTFNSSENLIGSKTFPLVSTASEGIKISVKFGSASRSWELTK